MLLDSLTSTWHLYHPSFRERRGPERPESVRATSHPQADVEVNGLRLRYIDVAPTGGRVEGPPLLLIHGHTSRIEEYDDLLPELARDRRVLLCDLPGSGYSDKPDREYSLRFYEDTLLGFLDARGVQECDLAGGSLGGNLVLRLGHRAPDRFRKLAAWAPAGAWKPLTWMARMGRALKGKLLFWPSVFGQSRFWYSERWPGRHRALVETFRYYREVLSAGFIRMYWDMALDQIANSHFGYAPEIRQPTFLAWGDEDHGLNMGEGVKELRRLIPGSRLTVYRGARHSLANEIPSRLGADVRAFLQGAAA